MKKKVILYIAMSLDGFVAREDGAVDWLDKFSSSGEDYGYKDFFDSISTIVMGKTTYKQIVSFGEFPYKGKNCFVFSKQATKDENVAFVEGNVKEFIENLDDVKDNRVWLVGGGNLVQQFLQHNLIDEYIISVIPILLSKGIRLFSEGYSELDLTLKKVESYKTGVTQMIYERTP